MRLKILLLAMLGMTAYPVAATERCSANNKTHVAANGECLVITVYGRPADRTSHVVFIHGDGSRGGRPSDCWDALAQRYGPRGVVANNLIRPGYFDSKGNHSTGDGYRKGDNCRSDVIETLSAAIEALRDH